VLSIRDLCKSFGPTRALDGVSLSVARGEVHALCGQNGAGKSTLLSIVTGLSGSDSGAMLLDGEPYRPRSPRDAHRRGLAFVPQEPTLALHMTVTENVVLGREPTTWGFVRTRAARDVARRALSLVGAEIDPDRQVLCLPPAERQLVTIARALASEHVKLVILDEPTSSLAADDAERVLDAIERLAAAGAAVVFVSHHLGEVRKVADRVTVLSRGRVSYSGAMVSSGETLSASALADLIVGKALERATRARRPPGELLLEVDRLSGFHAPKEASLAVRRGRILGIAGLVGSGRTELLRAVYGLDAVRSGKVRVRHQTFEPTPRSSLDRGVGLVSEDRKGEGLMLPLSISDNVTITRLPTRLGFLREAEQRRAASALLERLRVVAGGPTAPAASLSGGNQQKIAIARLLHQGVDVFLLDEPTRGIDPESREAIYALMDQRANEGAAIVWVSSQLEELVRVCDEVAVMTRGQLGEAQDAALFDESSLLALVGHA
jgi:ribose transport system ATP-binding protein